MLELIVLSVVSVGAGSCFVALLPRIAAKCFSDVLGHLIKDASVRELVREVVTDVRDTNEEVASLFFKGKMREELMSVMVEVIGHEKFGANVSFMASRCMADDFLTHTISEGVQEALEDTSQREPIKSLMIEAMMDAKLQGALIKASTNTLKTGIKQALGDEELRADLTLIIREALQDRAHQDHSAHGRDRDRRRPHAAQSGDCRHGDCLESFPVIEPSSAGRHGTPTSEGKRFGCNAKCVLSRPESRQL